MLDDPSVDIVSECMPNHLHAREAVLALEAGRHLILEKPVAVDREELAALRAAARKADEAGLRTVVSFVLRWHPLVVNIRTFSPAGRTATSTMPKPITGTASSDLFQLRVIRKKSSPAGR
jgi:predicted dehydrogenase